MSGGQAAIIIERFAATAEIFDYLDREFGQMALGGIRNWHVGADSACCIIRCKKLSLSFSIERGRFIVGNPADPCYSGPKTLESAQTAVMTLKMLEDDDRSIP